MSQNSYPFTSRKDVLRRINQEPDFAIEAIRLIDQRKGWMASHRARVTKLIAKLDAGALTRVDYAEASAIAGRYSRTLARILREKALAEHPALAAIGVVFGVVPAGATVGPDAGATVPEVVLTPARAVTTATTASEASPEVEPKKRRGRPPGSRNTKPRKEPAPAQRRRARS